MFSALSGRTFGTRWTDSQGDAWAGLYGPFGATDEGPGIVATVSFSVSSVRSVFKEDRRPVRGSLELTAPGPGSGRPVPAARAWVLVVRFV